MATWLSFSRSIMKQQEGEARWLSPRLARLPRYLEGVLMSSHMDDFFGWADFHHINLTLKVSSHCTRISPEIRFLGTFVQKSINKSKNVLLMTNMYFWRALHILLCSPTKCYDVGMLSDYPRLISPVISPTDQETYSSEVSDSDVRTITGVLSFIHLRAS